MRQFSYEPAGAQSYEQAPPPMSHPINIRPGRRAALSVRVEPSVVASIARFDSIINRVAAERGMDGNIIRGIIAAESGGNPNAGSGGGYKGLMQAGRDASQYDPETSIRTGAGKFVQFRSTISTLLRSVGINLSAVDRETTVRWVATSYNAGPGTVIKAVRYAAAAGNAGNWMQPEHFQRALINTGAYSIAQAASSCLRGQQQGPGAANLIAAAGRERMNLKGRDIPLAQVRSTVSPLLLCAIEFKHRNIPRYVERILTYVRHFDRQASSPARESFEFHEDGFGIGSNYVGWQNGMNRESGFGRDEFGFETNSQEWEVGVNRSSADYIKWVQESLNRILVLRLATDGAMGPQTRSAIRSFQRQKGLVVDGLLGSKTEAALIAAGAASPTGTSDAVDFDPFNITGRPPNLQQSSCAQFTPVAVETPGGERIQNKKIPDSSDIVIVQGAFAKTPLHRLAAEALNALVCAARADGIKHPQLLPTGSISGFRSPKLQERIRKSSEAIHGSKDLGTWVGKPGFSAHQSGRAIDFYLGTANDRRKVTILRQTSAYKWMAANARRFGFYPYPTEPWHWEYNPPASAQPEVFSEMGESFDYEDEFAELARGSGYGSAVPDVAGEVSSSGVNRNSPAYIQWVQNSLNNVLGLRLAVDGDSGPQTRNAIRSFQRRAGLVDDGKVGAQTERALIAAGASTPSVANTSAGSSATVSSSPASSPALINRETAPKLLGSERASYGETLYLQISLGMGKNLASTGIFVPNSFRPDSDIAVVLYLHGFKGMAPGNDVLINGYWDGARFPFFALREEVAASGRNVIFVAPSLGNKSEAGSLIQRGGFDAFMLQVLAGFNEHFLMPRHGRRINDVQSIILAAHSGGGSPMLKIARGTDQYAMKVKECWCFDSMYGPVASDWIGWAKSHSQQSLYVYSGPAKDGYDEKRNKRVLPRDNAEGIAREALKQRLANICVLASRAQSAGKVSAHFWVPIVHLKERLLKSPCV